MHVVHVIIGLDNGGAEKSLFNLVVNDNRNKHTVISLTDEGVYGDQLLEKNIAIYSLSLSGGVGVLSCLFKLYLLYKKLNPDVVQTWMYHADFLGGLTAKWLGIERTVWGVRGEHYKEFTTLSTRFTAKLCAIFSGWLPDAVVVNSESAKEKHLLLGYKKDKFAVIHNGCDTLYKIDQSLLTELSDEIDHDISVPLIGMVARYDDHKDHLTLFKTLHVLKNKNINFRCMLVGNGIDTHNDKLIKLIREYELSDVVILQGVSKNVPEIMSLIDIHVLSSISESFPNVLLEAMLYGTPCVTTDVGDSVMIVGDLGWVVPPADVTALAEAIEKAIIACSDTHNWNKRKKLCRWHVIENFNLERMIKKYNNVWRSINDE